MSTPAQIAANRANALLSTGPTTESGKAAVAQNRLAHGLASERFNILPIEDASEYELLLAGYVEEHQPSTQTEHFLVCELARAQWKLARIAAMEAHLLMNDDAEPIAGWRELAGSFAKSCSSSQAILKLGRYEQATRRAFHKSLATLRSIQEKKAASAAAAAPSADALLEAFLTPPVSRLEFDDSKPMPPRLAAELASHRRRDPLFDTVHDASQMSRDLQRWFRTRETPTAPVQRT